MKALAVALSSVAFAALVGWIKTVYFFRPFGVSPAALDFSWVSWPLASWYVVQNTVYLGAIAWLVVQTRRFALALLLVAYALIPLASHYAFLLYDRPGVRFWVDHQHTWLKLIPAVLLAGLVVGRMRGNGPDWRWRHGRAGWFLLAIVAASWSVSAAKHLGSYDAQRILHDPDALLPRVELVWNHPPTAVPEIARTRFLLHEDAKNVVVVEFDPDEPRTPRVRTVAREALRQVTVTPPGGVQPGGQYL